MNDKCSRKDIAELCLLSARDFDKHIRDGRNPDEGLPEHLKAGTTIEDRVVSFKLPKGLWDNLEKALNCENITFSTFVYLALSTYMAAGSLKGYAHRALGPYIIVIEAFKQTLNPSRVDKQNTHEKISSISERIMDDIKKNIEGLAGKKPEDDGGKS